MDEKLQQKIAFYFTGCRDGSDLRPMDGQSLPSLLARRCDLSSLRYDFPLVLNEEGQPERAVLSLTSLVDDAVNAMEPGIDRDRMARHAYRIERELRRDLAAGGPGDFEAMWNAAAERLADAGDDSVRHSARWLWTEFYASGALIDVNTAMPASVVQHVWNSVEAGKARSFRRNAERLLHKLRDILSAE
jgi:hypothetical protein